MELYQELMKEFEKILVENKVLHENIEVNVKSLSNEEAIGRPKRRDFPLLNGKEQMVKAEFRGAIGQAFTSYPVVFSGSLREILNLDLENNYNKAIFISSLNAVMKSLGLIENTVHCKNEEMEICGDKVCKFILENYPKKKVGLVGYQPAILDNLSRNNTNVRIIDLNPDNIGKIRYNVEVESGQVYRDFIKWADVLLVTGSTITNSSIVDYINIEKEVYFYGNTIAGAAKILGLNRLCSEAS